MREIKFRAWASLTKVMIDEETIFNNFKGYAENKNYILLQFTGLKDKNGVEIYEGDLLQVFYAVDHPYVVHAKWDTEKAGFHRVSDYGYGAIIGNIYENPELL